jgi:hypothetical protein
MKPRHLIPALLCALLLAYPLSFGPYARYRLGKPATPAFFVNFYRPLVQACLRFRWCGDLMDSYLNFWVPERRSFD